MNVSPSKENILKKIRKALSQSTPIPFPGSEGNTSVYHPSIQELEVEFAEQFSKLLGKFAYCMDVNDLNMQLQSLLGSQKLEKVFCNEPRLAALLPSASLKTPLHEDLPSCDVAITSCECLVARTGTMVLSAAQASGRTASVYAPIHICVATVDQLVYDLKDAFVFLKDKYGNQLPSMISFATGPSRTADIEKTLVVGVHGPKEVYLFLVEQMPSF